MQPERQTEQLRPIKQISHPITQEHPLPRLAPRKRAGHPFIWRALCIFSALCALGTFGVNFLLIAKSPLRPKSLFPQSFSTVPRHSPLEVQAETKAADVNAVIKETAQKKLQQLEQHIDQMRQNGQDVTTYQHDLDQERTQLANAKKPGEYVSLLIQMGTDLSKLQKERANNDPATMLSNYLDTVQQWGDDHKYHDAYDGQDYYLNSSYLVMDGGNGIHYGYGAYMQNAVNAGDPDALQNLEDGFFLHSMLEANYIDQTPYNQPHQVDQQLLNYFGVAQDHVLLVSLTEQAMRVYRNGVLEDATLVTTGRHHRPTPPGLFRTTAHLYNVPFVSSDPPGSPDYYETVIVRLAIQFWTNGYYLHTADWRTDFGPFTNFPHYDTGGNSDANDGSHGCVNVPTETLTRLDPTITTDTKVIIF